MANNKYPSKYSNGKDVSAAQYLTELICENKAKINKEDLHFKFWQSPKWEKFFRNQIASANKLLKKYDIIPIIRALKTPKGQKIYSLRAPHLIDIITQEVAKLSETHKKSIKIDRIDKPKTKQNKAKKNILSKLEEIDNGD
jgi:hypothetical protein